MERKKTRRVVVEFIVGGAWPRYATASNADVVVLIDSQDEVDQVPEMTHLIKVPLGGQDTVLSLLERLQKARPEAGVLLAEYRRRQSVHLGAGMAQDPRLGACAIQDLALRGDLRPIFDQVFIRVLEAANGQLELLVVRELNSNAGGMGAGGGPEVGGLFCAYAAKRTSAKIRRHMVRLGGLTYAAVAPRAFINVGQTSAANLALMLDEPIPVWELRELECYELPLRSEEGLAIGDNRDVRGLLAGTLAQARFTPEVSRLLRLREVNETPASRFGGLLRARAWWSESLDADRLMRAAASTFASS